MRTDTPPAPVRLADYRPPAFLIDTVALDFRLDAAATRVRARLQVRRNGVHAEPLVLDGEQLKTLGVILDGRALAEGDYRIDDGRLSIAAVPDSFVLETEVEINPAANSTLMGLYISGGRFCTQCEAEGFRRITWYPDRPDVLARYSVRLEADRAVCPRLLSNGNQVEAGDLANGRHYAVWEDPFPKPSYLFALVAGELDELADTFVTASGREVALRVYVDPGQAPRAAYALDALKRAMAWDERAYGREYDLDLFMIVAVRDFNFGAMENKGLNIFNSSLLLADPETATDADYERIESVVAHEYFHNWTGNRITCRDWFQLCVKEGLTVFRDQGFSADERSAAVSRIKDVKALRARQFAEDAGPLAHPARPESYLKIDNFYTATVYEKGAEIVRLLKLLVGDDGFRAGMDHYFERFDGQAVTVEDFVAAFETATDRDLSNVFRWYAQAGRPVLEVKAAWDETSGALTLDLAQTTAPTPGQPDKAAVPIPIRLGLLDTEGRPQSFTVEAGETGEAVEETVLVLDRQARTVRLGGVGREPVLSLLRGFSAPVDLSFDEPPEHRFIRLASDPDLFNRWEAGQSLGRQLMLARAAGRPDPDGEARYAAAVGRALADQGSEPAFKALMLVPPGETELAQAMSPVDPVALHDAREHLRRVLATALRPDLERLHAGLADSGPFSASAEAAGRRALRNAALDLLAAGDPDTAAARAERHYRDADNMTDMLGGLSALMTVGGAPWEAALSDFADRWRHEPLVMDKWFALQARSPAANALERVRDLTRHPLFEPRNPNRLRALVGAFSQANPARFHRADGAGYRFLADQILAVDAINPMVAARLVEPLGSWRRYQPDLAAAMRAELERIAAHPGLSGNVRELVTRALAT